DTRQRVVFSLTLEPRVPEPAPLEVASEAGQRIAGGPVADLFGRLVAPRIVGGRVRTEAIRECLNQDRTVAPPRPLECPVAHRVHRQSVVAVDEHTCYAVAETLLRQRLAGGLASARHTDRPAVVLHEEHGARAVDACEVQRLREIALRRCAVPD